MHRRAAVLVSVVSVGVAFASCASAKPGREPDTGAVSGVVLDEREQPIPHAKIDVIPLGAPIDRGWNVLLMGWSSASGEYVISDLEPGRYFVSIHRFSAPTAEFPFRGVYYPGVEDKMSAALVTVAARRTTHLRPVKLRSVELATVTVNVRFEDGVRPVRSNLSFHNPLFRQAVIGDVAPQIDDGRGVFQIPAGFDYVAQAGVTCELATMLEHRESQPPQHVTLRKGSHPELTFVIPGPACKLR